MLFGIAKVEIVKLAREQNIDLVVMGSRGLGAVKRSAPRTHRVAPPRTLMPGPHDGARAAAAPGRFSGA